MSESRAIHPVATLCRVLGVSSRGQYAWSMRALSRRAKDDAGLIERIGAIHEASKGTACAAGPEPVSDPATPRAAPSLPSRSTTLRLICENPTNTGFDS